MIPAIPATRAAHADTYADQIGGSNGNLDFLELIDCRAVHGRLKNVWMRVY